MKIYLIAVGNRLSDWVVTGYQEYARRLQSDCTLHLREIAPARRGKGQSVAAVVAAEGERILKAIPAGSRVVALEVEGRAWSTEQLAARCSHWLASGRDVALLVGGPEGLAEECRQRAEESWSLSPLTFPHPLVRVMLAEQLYRAWSLLHNHPYHRA